MLALAIALTVATTAAVHFHGQAAALRQSPTPTVPDAARSRSGPTASPSPSSPSVPARPTVAGALLLRSHGFPLDSGRIRGTIYFTYEVLDGLPPTRGQLVVSGIVRGAAPGGHYRLAGGACEGGRSRVWASGVADAAGTVAFQGPTWALPKAVAYYLALERTTSGTDSGPHPGLEGTFVLGQAVPNGEHHAPCL